MSISSKAAHIPPFIVMDVLEQAQKMEREQHADVIHLEVGEPDFDTPDCIIEAAIRALKDAKTHYTHSLGLWELREAITEYYAKTYEVTISPDQIIVTSGTSPAMILVFSAILEQSDEIILSNPHYACYPNFIKMFDGIPKYVNVYEENGFQYTIEGIQAQLSSRTKGIMINSPSNPTGNLLAPDVMQRDRGIFPLDHFRRNLSWLSV